jgi:hypothetical protein
MHMLVLLRIFPRGPITELMLENIDTLHFTTGCDFTELMCLKTRISRVVISGCGWFSSGVFPEN